MVLRFPSAKQVLTGDHGEKIKNKIRGEAFLLALFIKISVTINIYITPSIVSDPWKKLAHKKQTSG